MNPIPVLPSETPAASTSASQADRSSSGPEADSGFGPALLAASNASPSFAAGAATEGKPSAGPGAATGCKPSPGPAGGPQRSDSRQPSRGGSGQGQTAGVDGSVAAAAMVASALAAPSFAAAAAAEGKAAVARDAAIATGSPAVAAAAAQAGDAIDAQAATGNKAGTDPASTAAPEPATDALRLILAERERSQALAAGSQDPAGTDATAGVLRADGSIKGDAARTAAQAMRDAAAAAADAAGQNPVADLNAPGLPAGAASLGRDGVQAIAQALNGALQAAAPKALVDAPSQTGAPAVVSTADSARPDGASATVAFTAAAPYASDVRDSVATAVGHPQFAQDLSQHVVVMARNGVQSAQISLEPAGLGPVGVSIQVNGHSATLAFTAAHEATRNALQDALPRLREMFASSGMQLSDATVGGRSQPDWGTPAQPQAWGRADEGPAAGPVASPETGATTRPEAARLVDTYA